MFGATEEMGDCFAMTAVSIFAQIEVIFLVYITQKILQACCDSVVNVTDRQYLVHMIFSKWTNLSPCIMSIPPTTLIIGNITMSRDQSVLISSRFDGLHGFIMSSTFIRRNVLLLSLY